MEGLQIAFAWAGALKLTQAAEEIERLKRLKVTDPEPETRSSEAYVLAFGGKRADLVGKDFLEMAAIVACRLGQGLFEAHHIEVEIAKQGDVVIHYKSGRERTWLVFFYFGKARLFSPRPVRVTVDISGKVLKWIYDVTEGA
jgi:hypothetical protein